MPKPVYVVVALPARKSHQRAPHKRARQSKVPVAFTGQTDRDARLSYFEGLSVYEAGIQAERVGLLRPHRPRNPAERERHKRVSMLEFDLLGKRLHYHRQSRIDVERASRLNHG